jgi:hypothetical protein
MNMFSKSADIGMVAVIAVGVLAYVFAPIFNAYQTKSPIRLSMLPT